MVKLGFLLYSAVISNLFIPGATVRKDNIIANPEIV